MFFRPLEQFQIYPLMSFKLGVFDLSFTNGFLIILISLFSFFRKVEFFFLVLSLLISLTNLYHSELTSLLYLLLNNCDSEFQLAALFNFFSLGTKVEPKITFQSHLNEQICPPLTSPVKEVKFFATPISSGNKSREFNPEKTFQDLQEISTNLDRWNQFNLPACNLQAFNEKLDTAFMQKVAAEFDKNSELKQSFEKYIKNYETQSELDSATEAFLKKTPLGETVLKEHGSDGLTILCNVLKDDNYMQSDTKVSMFDRWANTINAICFSKEHFDALKELQILFSDFNEITAERKQVILSLIKVFYQDLNQHPVLFMLLAGFSDFSFVESLKNSVLNLEMLKNLLESTDLSGVFKALMNALFRSRENIICLFDSLFAFAIFPERNQLPEREKYVDFLRAERLKTQCNFKGLTEVSEEVDNTLLEQSEQGENNNNPHSLLGIIITLGLKFLLSKTVISSLVLGSFFALSKTIFFKNMVSKFCQFFFKK